MIKSISDETRILVCIFLYSILYCSLTELLVRSHKKERKYIVLNTLNDLLFLLLMFYISYHFSYNLYDGYIPKYFILIFIVGILIYSTFIRNYVIKLYSVIHLFVSKYINKFIKSCLYSNTIFTKVKIVIVRMIKRIKKIKKKKTRNKDNNISN